MRRRPHIALAAFGAAAIVLALMPQAAANGAPATGTLVVQVVRDGALIPNASINLRAAKESSWDGAATRMTDDSGSTTYPPLPPQRYVVTARILQHFVNSGDVANTYLADTVEVVAGHTTYVTIDFASTGSISGHINFDPSLPAGPRTVYIEAYQLDELGGLAQVGRSGSPSTIASPQFLIEDLPVGEVYLRTTDVVDSAIEPDYFDGAARWYDADPVTVEAGQLTGGVEMSVLPKQAPEVVRFGGATRFDMAVSVSQHGFPDELVGDGVPVVFIANGLNFPDALAAGPVAAPRGPLLLTAPAALPGAVRVELARLAPKQIVIVGGPASVAPSVEAELGAFAPEVTRVTGADRFEVSRTLARMAFPEGSDIALVATGLNFPDALAAGAYGGAAGAPVILVNGLAWDADAATKQLIADLGVKTLFLIGGPVSLHPPIGAALGAVDGVQQVRTIAERDRFENALAIPTLHTVGDEVFVANGMGFSDALAGSWLAGRYQAKLILLQPSCVPWNAQWSLPAAETVYVLGGTNSISDQLIAEQPICAW